MEKIFSSLISLLFTSLILICCKTKRNHTYQSIVRVTESAVSRMLTEEHQRQWWPGTKAGENLYKFKHCNFQIRNRFYTGFTAVVYCDNDSALLQLQVRDSTRRTAASVFQWEVTALSAPYSGQLDQHVRDLITQIESYFKTELNIYGTAVLQESVTDTLLIATRKTFSTPPSTEAIYTMIEQVRAFIKIKKGQERSYPMLNVSQESREAYKVMVGMPITKELTAETPFLLKRLVPGQILVTEVKGGPAAIAAAQQQMELYIQDHKKSSPAIPYQSLVTDRRAQPDTAQWITRLYYPVFF